MSHAFQACLGGIVPVDKALSNLEVQHLQVGCDAVRQAVEVLATEVVNIREEVETLVDNPSDIPFNTLNVFYYGAQSLLPNNVIPDPLGPPVAPGVRYVKYLDLGRVVRTAWVCFPFEYDVDFNFPPGVNPIFTLADSFAGQIPGYLTGSMLYVTEDYNRTQRYGAYGAERNPTNIYPVLPPPPGPPYPNDTADPLVGFGTLRKTYGELGGYVFGVYYSGPMDAVAVVNPQSLGMGGAYGAKPFYIEAVYLDNTSGPTTRLNIVFRMKYIPGLFTTPPGPFSYDDFSRNNFFTVYPIT